MIRGFSIASALAVSLVVAACGAAPAPTLWTPSPGPTAPPPTSEPTLGPSPSSTEIENYILSYRACPTGAQSVNDLLTIGVSPAVGTVDALTVGPATSTTYSLVVDYSGTASKTRTTLIYSKADGSVSGADAYSQGLLPKLSKGCPAT